MAYRPIYIEVSMVQLIVYCIPYTRAEWSPRDPSRACSSRWVTLHVESPWAET